MATIFDRDDVPDHVLNIHELDLSGDLFIERLEGPWFRLGAQTIRERRSQRGIEEAISRESVLLDPGGFAEIFDKLEAIGNTFDRIGKPGGVLGSGKAGYAYIPFYRFEFPFTSAIAEPLVFLHEDTQGVEFFIDPDLWMYFELEERAPASGIWWDPRRGVDVIVKTTLEDGLLRTVDIRTDYLRKYLRARQMSLIVGHYRHLHFFNPPATAIAGFVKTDVTLGSAARGVKAILQNWGLRNDCPGLSAFLQRRLHLWLEIKPPPLDKNDPWDERPSFDIYSFTLPTSTGPVAPARWKRVPGNEGRSFQGAECDFMDRVYFRQEVLTKYEGAAGFDVKDDGSVSCRHYWGLVRSTGRLGNELISTAIGDFAEGVPFEEWPHWKQYAVDPPSTDSVNAIVREPKIPEVVNSVINALKRLNTAFANVARSVRVAPVEPLWRGSLDSLATRQLKCVYPATADDDEFLKRATLASTLVIEGLQPSIMRSVAQAFGSNLHQSLDSNAQTLGSRKLLERLAVIVRIVEQLHPDWEEVPLLAQQAEKKAQNASPDLQAELESILKDVRNDFAALAFLYDLRNSGGLAHSPNKGAVVAASANLGLPKENWHRMDFIGLLRRISESLDKVSEHFERVAEQIAR